MRNIREMFDKIHPEHEVKQQIIKQMMDTTTTHRFGYKKAVMASICFILCVGTLYFLQQENKTNSDGYSYSYDQKQKNMENAISHDLTYAKMIATPNENETDIQQDTMDTKILSMEEYTQRQNIQTSFHMKLVPDVLMDKENKVYSPLSLMYVFGMLDHGLYDTGKEQLETYLGITQKDLEDSLLANSRNYEEIQGMYLSNSIWIDNKHTVNTTTLQSIADLYHAESYMTDFADQKAIKEINDYVYKETKEMISLQLKPNPNHALMFMNVIAVESKWKNEFVKDNEVTTFHLDTGKEIETEYIKGKDGNGNYLQTDQYELVDIPLANSFQLRVVLPNTDSSITNVLQDKKQLESILNKKFTDEDERYDITVHLPKFTIASEYTFNQILQEHGVTEIFQNSQSLKNFGENLLVNDIFQKAYIEVNEEGLRAAAVSGSIMNSMAALENEKKIEITFDRPFLYVLQDDRNQVIFIGTLYNPTK